LLADAPGRCDDRKLHGCLHVSVTACSLLSACSSAQAASVEVAQSAAEAFGWTTPRTTRELPIGTVRAGID
jgi:hypothetical protein